MPTTHECNACALRPAASVARAAANAKEELERALEAEKMKAAAREAQAKDEQLQELSKAFEDSEQVMAWCMT